MRSSKSRSRSKTNRPRTLGNIINRVFDSSGPEGKVRGTPQQIIEKYQMLAGDAQRSNDRVAAENFSQHAEHYTRMLAEATREMAAEQESRQSSHPQNGNSNQNRQGEYRNDGRNDGNYSDGEQPYAAGFDVIGGDSGEGDQQDQDRQPQERQQQDRQQQDRQPRREEYRRDDRPRNDGQRNDQQRGDQPRNDQQPRQQNNNRPRNEQPRRDDRPREPRADYRPEQRTENRVEPRPEQRSEPQLRFVETPAPEAVQNVAPLITSPMPVFESPAELIAQIEAKAPPRARAPRVKKPVQETSAE